MKDKNLEDNFKQEYWKKEIENIKVMPKKFFGEDYKKAKQGKGTSMSKIFLYIVIVVIGLGLIGGGIYVFVFLKNQSPEPEPLTNIETEQSQLNGGNTPEEKTAAPVILTHQVKNDKDEFIGEASLSLFLSPEINQEEIVLSASLSKEAVEALDSEYVVIGPIYNIEPLNILLTDKSTITLTYNQNDIPLDMEQELQLGFLVDGKWQKINRAVDILDNKVVVEINNFLSNSFALIIEKSLLESGLEEIEDLGAAINSPSSLDTDEDGLTDKEEELYGTNQLKPDTDEDSYSDGFELVNLYNPLKADGVKLAVSGLVNIYTNPIYQYTIFHPAGWLARALDETHQEVIFTTSTSELLEVIITGNSKGLSVESWYREQMGDIDLSQLRKTKVDGYNAVWSLNNQTIYVGTPERIYTLTYQSGTEEKLNFKTTFEMMIKSFKLPKISDLEIQSSNDAMRLTDIELIQVALEMYYRDQSRYPAQVAAGESIMTQDDVYLPNVPANPNPGGIPYQYQVSTDGSSYTLRFKLEVGSGDYDAGTYIASPGKIETIAL